ncbi:peptidoglycan D,D-transpeptidase FtsI family protein [Agromyces archimandritae]|uniref:Penicillin-binding protein 2 n=1 Tax=Agromyces archimandritae TaxID=2781962 RepID=A0A975IQD2_9MICO|nr:penicillin-binding protein 2 [Agromyces archimandritae]QTX04911.1 penicillin-binding protein 2 [Agromyces archimandritae]
MSNRRGIRRVFVFGLVLIAFVAVFVVRLVDIQVVRAEELSRAADEVRSSERVVPGTRGEILDANGEVLAGSVMRWDVALSPSKAVTRQTPDPDDPAGSKPTRLAAGTVDEELDRDAAAIAEAVGKKKAEILELIRTALEDDPDSDWAQVAKRVDNDARDRVRALELPWLTVSQHPMRVYPNGAVAGNLLGFTDVDGNPLAGLELGADRCIAGEDGLERYLASRNDWVEIPGSATTIEPAREGGSLHLTVETDLQWFVQSVAAQRVQETGAKWATVTVMEAKTGRLLAVADVPTVDPNDPAATDSEDRGSRTFTAPFEPGSTFKAVTAASVLDAGKATPLDQIVAPFRYLPPNGADINDSSGHEDMRLTLTGVLIESSNTGMSQFGERMSDAQRYEDMRKFGFGQETEVGFPGEEPGDLHGDPGDWDPQTKYATMFGQGLTTTAVQVASAYQAIANGGVRMPVTLSDGCELPDGTMTEVPERSGTRVVSEQAAEQTSLMLEQVYEHGWLAGDWEIPGYRVAAKTGTAQVPGPDGHYLPGYLVSVSGFAPVDDPEFVVSVSIMDPVKMNSSAASAPVFQQVMSQVLKTHRTVPSGAEAPELPGTW